jgi:hypothetical protein
MNSLSYRFIDANVVMYSLGGSHPLRDPCKATLEKIREGGSEVVTNTEVLQEILYRFFSIKKYSLGELVYTSMVELCVEVLPVTLKDTHRALELLKRTPDITSRDAIHAATMINNGVEEIYSTDPHFDLIPEIRRLQPHSNL